MKKYPEHEKLAKIKDKSQSIGEFLEWLESEKKVNLCTYEAEYTMQDSDGEDEIIPEGYYGINQTKEKLLAEFFDIDLNKIEEEKRQMLAEMNKNSQK